MQFADVACVLKTQPAIVVLAVRLGTLFFFNQNVILNEISLVLFIAVFVVAVVIMVVKLWKWRTKWQLSALTILHNIDII